MFNVIESRVELEIHREKKERKGGNWRSLQFEAMIWFYCGLFIFLLLFFEVNISFGSLTFEGKWNEQRRNEVVWTSMRISQWNEKRVDVLLIWSNQMRTSFHFLSFLEGNKHFITLRCFYLFLMFCFVLFIPFQVDLKFHRKIPQLIRKYGHTSSNG